MGRSSIQQRSGSSGMNPQRAGYAVLLLLGLAACNPGERAEVVDALIFAPADVQVLGSSEGIGEVQDLEVLPDGSVWILNSLEPYFIGFDARGSIIGRHGASGGGPEEFRGPAGFVPGGIDGEAWTLDPVRHAFIRVSTPNEEWTQLSIPRDEIPTGTVRGGMSLLNSNVRTARIGDELILPWSTGTLESGISTFHMSLLRANLAAFNPETGSVRTIVSLGEVMDDPSVGFVATDGGFPLWYRLWAACGDHLRVHDRVQNQLRGFTASGEELDPIDLPPVTLTEVTAIDFARAVFPLREAEVTGEVGRRLSAEDKARLVRQMAQRLTGTPHELAAYLPRYVDFRCSDTGFMWIQPIDIEIGGLNGGPMWLRIDPDGRMDEVHFPQGFDALRFTTDRVWGVQRDEFDVASVAWIEF